MSQSSSDERYFKITGLDCAEEVAILKAEVGPAVGGEQNLAFDILNGRMAVKASAGNVSSQRIVQVVAQTGMRAEPWQEGEVAQDEGRNWDRQGRAVATAVSGALGLVAFLVQAVAAPSLAAALGFAAAGEEFALPWVARVLYALSILAGVWYFLPKAWHALIRVRPDMNLLMTVAVIGAVVIGQWAEAATVAFLFAVSLLLESWSVGRARRAIAALMTLTPPTARLISPAGEEQLVAPEDVPVGSAFLVRPGERIPLDGKITAGRSDVNQAAITGESVPLAKDAGDDVFAGTINGDGVLQVQSTRPATDTTLARIIRMVGAAQSKRAPSEQWVEKFARVYTPAVMAISLAIFLVPPLLLGGAWHTWFYNALVLLVIACPCALVISTPVSIVAGIAAAARQGVLIKGGVYLELPAQLRAIALDKTGTLTQGHPAVVEVVPLNGHTDRELLERAAALESHSDHPLARAIVRYAQQQRIEPRPADDFRILQGKGATGRFAGREFWLGSHRYLEERTQETPELHEQLEAMSSAGRSVVVVGNDRHVCGFVALADTIRPQARAVMEELHREGVQRLVMLTGDNRPTAEAIARETNVDECRAELLPADKVQAIEKLVGQYGQVAMVGDGVNDAPALGRATVGIAMGAAGSDAAIETADIALMSDDLAKLPWLIRHSRRCGSIIRQNIVAALAVKVLFLALTLAGHASLWAAIAADMGVSLLVIMNGLRLLSASERRQGG